jgi:alpha-glucoside transport system substrate-binding protein
MFRLVLEQVGPDESDTYVVDVIPLGDNIGAALNASDATVPDLVMLPEPGQVQTYARQGKLRAFDPSLWGTNDERYTSRWRDLLYYNGAPYGLPFKAAHKSLVWYRKPLMAAQNTTLTGPNGAVDPENWTWDNWLEAIDILLQRDITPLAMGGGDGWVLTDMLENILLAAARSTYYKLARPGSSHPWAVAGFRKALRILGELWRREGLFAGGVDGALRMQFPDAVQEVFAYERAAMVVTPDFAEPIVRDIFPDERVRDEQVGLFQFPAIEGNPRPLVAGGDIMVLPAAASRKADDLARRLADRTAPADWIAEHGGFISPNKETNQLIAQKRLRTSSGALVRYSMSIGDRVPDLEEEYTGSGVDDRFSFDLSDEVGQVGGRDVLQRALTEFLGEIGDGRGRELDKPIEKVIHTLRCFETPDTRSCG